MHSLAGKRFFTTLDLECGFWQIALDPESKEKTAFISIRGLFHFNRLPFGVKNGPPTCQRLMESVLRGLLWESCLIYVDDIIIFSNTFEQHLVHLREVFQRLKDANMKT